MAARNGRNGSADSDDAEPSEAIIRAIVERADERVLPLAYEPAPPETARTREVLEEEAFQRVMMASMERKAVQAQGAVIRLTMNDEYLFEGLLRVSYARRALIPNESIRKIVAARSAPLMGDANAALAGIRRGVTQAIGELAVRSVEPPPRPVIEVKPQPQRRGWFGRRED